MHGATFLLLGDISLNDVVSIFSAFAAVAAVIIALAPDWMKAVLVKRDLVLEEINVTGQDERDIEGEKKCFHLLVRNTSKWRFSNQKTTAWWPFEYCRAFLIAIQRRTEAGTFEPWPFPVRRQFVWAPGEDATDKRLTLYDEELLDLGALWKEGKVFRPKLYAQGGELKGDIGPNQAVRYVIKIVADHFEPVEYSCEIDWDGVWVTGEQVRDHFKIKVAQCSRG